ncbi:MAG: glycosyltransferase family 4 protein [Gammaproteobacteria bacterium]|nr:glycosyltransferase family 4 protein [Gammaproteobacteria bacterium]
MDSSLGNTWCFEIISDAFYSDNSNITGRRAAGQSFFDAFAEHAHPLRVLLVNDSPETFNQFASKFNSRQDVLSVPPNNVEALLAADIFYQSSPLICQHAWLRRYVSDSAFSLCGITHSVATERVICGIQEYITAPLCDWDALICTSKAAQSAVIKTLSEREVYLHERGFKVAECKIQTPVIPLGVNTATYKMDEGKRQLRKELRHTKGIAVDDVAGIYIGRMDCLSKCHPTPLFISMELAQKKLVNTKLHLLMVGQFQNSQMEVDFKKSARIFAPSVNVHWVDGSRSQLVEGALAAADFFLSLSDNIQESYGLALVEAMSAGLPVIASDWDGYRDTVIDNHTGLLIKTTFPPEHTGSDLARGLALQNIDYRSYLGVLSQFTAVDVQQCSEAITALAKDANMRGEMSQNATKRAKETYDWQKIIQRYEELAGELTQRRRHYEKRADTDNASQSRNIAYPNPLSIFFQHPSNALNDNMVLSSISDDYASHINLLLGLQIHAFARSLMLDLDDMLEMMDKIDRSSLRVRDLLNAHPEGDHIKILNSVMWLYKFGVVKVADLEQR